MIRRRFRANSAINLPLANVDMRLRLSPRGPSGPKCEPGSAPLPSCPPVIVDPNDGSDPVSVPAGDAYTCPNPSPYWHDDQPYWIQVAAGVDGNGVSPYAVSEPDTSNQISSIQLPAGFSFAAVCQFAGNLDPAINFSWGVEIEFSDAPPIMFIANPASYFYLPDAGYNYSLHVLASADVITLYCEDWFEGAVHVRGVLDGAYTPACFAFTS